MKFLMFFIAQIVLATVEAKQFLDNSLTCANEDYSNFTLQHFHNDCQDWIDSGYVSGGPYKTTYWTKCLKSCILEGFYIIRPRQDTFRDGRYEMESPHNTENYDKTKNLFPVFFSDEITDKLTQRIVDSCAPIMKELIGVQKLPCEKWDPIYDCVDEAFKCE